MQKIDICFNFFILLKQISSFFVLLIGFYSLHNSNSDMQFHANN